MFFELSKGRHPERLPASDAVALDERYEAQRGFLARLEAFKPIDRQDEISLAVMRLKLRDLIDDYEFGRHLVPMDAEGGFYNRLLFMLPRLPFRTVADYDAYIGWLPGYLDYLDTRCGLMAAGIERGIVAPAIVVKNNLGLLRPFLSGADTHPLMAPFRTMGDDLGEAERQRLLDAAGALFETRILPAHRAIETFLRGSYSAAAPQAPGIGGLANGRDYYENRIRFYTTLSMTPDEVFDLGESEVRRIRTLMEACMLDAGFGDGLEAFIRLLRSDARFYPETAAQLLHHAAWIAKRSEGKLPGLFGTLYRTPFTVEPVPDEIAPNYTAGRYVQLDPEQHRPGVYWVNVYDLPSRSLYNLPALTLHEAVPGHHLQIALARERGDIPAFRNEYYISAFGEGWGLYAEFLGEEMGMYATPYERFGRYTYEMWRACRLVVDVGIHYKGWSRARAIDFMRDNTALSEHEVETEIDRYIGWPGQAVSYKVGELTIKRLRAEAERELGDNFDLRAFHDMVLSNGCIPLDVLEQEVRRFIKSISKQVIEP